MFNQLLLVLSIPAILFSIGCSEGFNTLEEQILASKEKPVITILSQPQGQMLIEGNAVQLSVNAICNGNISYQWKRKGSGDIDFINIDGATSNTLDYPANLVTPGLSGFFQADITCTLEDLSVVESTDQAQLVVNLTPPVLAIVDQPQNIAVPEGTAISFNVAIMCNGAATYQWERKGLAENVYSPVAGATTDTLSYPAAMVNDTLNGLYRVGVTCALNGMSESATSEVAQLVVTPTPPMLAIQTQPLDVTILELSNAASFSVGATCNGTIAYQWERRGLNENAYSPINGETAASVSFAAAQVVPALSGLIRVGISCTLNGVSISQMSNAALLTVNVVPIVSAIQTQPQSQTPQEDNAFSLSVAASCNGAISYQWERKLAAQNAFNVLNGETSNSLSFAANEVVPAINGEYKVGVTCALNGRTAFVSSNAAVINVIPTPPELSITSQPQNVTIEELSGAATFNVGATCNGAIAYQWEHKGLNDNAFSPVNGATTNTLSFDGARVIPRLSGLVRAGITCTLNGVSISEMSDTALLTVNEAPIVVAIQTQPQSQAYQEGTAISLSVSASCNGAITYQWQSKLAGQNNFSNLSGETSNNLSFNANESVPGISGDYRSNVACELNGRVKIVTSNTATLTVTPIVIPPMLSIMNQPQGATVDEGTAVSFSVTASCNGAISYQWQSKPAGQNNFSNLSGETTSMLSYSSNESVPSLSGDFRVNLGCSFNGQSISLLSNAATLVVNPDVVIPPVDITATLSWLPPTMNEDGTMLTDLLGYNVHYGESQMNYMGTQTVYLSELTTGPDGRVSVDVTNNLFDPGAGNTKNIYFAVTALDTSFNESGKSNEASKLFGN